MWPQDPMTRVFALMIVFQLKHFLADYVFQTTWMLGKGKDEWGFMAPLAAHCGVHALGTLIIALTVDWRLAWLAIFDFVVHFIMDRAKAGPRYLGRYKDASKHAFWNALGFDQMVHHLTHIAIVWWLVLPPF